MERYSIKADFEEARWTVEMVTVCGAQYTPSQDHSALPCSDELACLLPPPS